VLGVSGISSGSNTNLVPPIFRIIKPFGILKRRKPNKRCHQGQDEEVVLDHLHYFINLDHNLSIFDFNSTPILPAACLQGSVIDGGGLLQVSLTFFAGTHGPAPEYGELTGKTCFE